MASKKIDVSIDYYEVLSVRENSPPEVIQGAYRALAKKFHPDSSKSSGGSERFVAATAAYEILNDAALRAEYDYLRLEQQIQKIYAESANNNVDEETQQQKKKFFQNSVIAIKNRLASFSNDCVIEFEDKTESMIDLQPIIFIAQEIEDKFLRSQYGSTADVQRVARRIHLSSSAAAVAEFKRQLSLAKSPHQVDVLIQRYENMPLGKIEELKSSTPFVAFQKFSPAAVHGAAFLVCGFVSLTIVVPLIQFLYRPTGTGYFLFLTNSDFAAIFLLVLSISFFTNVAFQYAFKNYLYVPLFLFGLVALTFLVKFGVLQRFTFSTIVVALAASLVVQSNNYFGPKVGVVSVVPIILVLFAIVVRNS